MTISLHVADLDDLRWVEEAVRTCPLAMAEFGGFYTEVSKRLPPMAASGRELLVISRGAARVGFLDTDVEPGGAAVGTLALSWFVVPAERGHHVTVDALALLREQRPGWRLLAAIDPANVPSLAVARRAGFVDQGATTWGEREHLLA